MKVMAALKEIFKYGEPIRLSFDHQGKIYRALVRPLDIISKGDFALAKMHVIEAADEIKDKISAIFDLLEAGKHAPYVLRKILLPGKKGDSPSK